MEVKISDLLKKENMYKAFAIGLILIFILSSFAAGFLSRQDGGSIRTNDNASSGYLEGDVVANATIVSYQPYIITELRNATAAEEFRVLADVEDVMQSASGYVITLKNSSNITGVYSYLQSRNVSGKANTLISLPPIVEIYTENASVNISGGEISAKLEPIFEEGENITVRVFVRALDRKIVAYGVVSVLPSQLDIEANASVVALAQIKTFIYVPWEKRYEISEGLANITQKYGEGNISYVRKDFVLANISDSVEERPAYVAFVAENTIYVGNFTNSGQVLTDLGNTTVFPDSLLVINAEIEAQEFGNFSRNYTYLYNAKINTGGEDMFFALESSTPYKQNDSVRVIISAYAIKGTISAIISAREAV